MLNPVMPLDDCKQGRLNKRWQGTLACLDRLLLSYGHDTTALKVSVAGLGQVDLGSLLRARIVTSGYATFQIATQQQRPKLLQSRDVGEFLI